MQQDTVLTRVTCACHQDKEHSEHQVVPSNSFPRLNSRPRMLLVDCNIHIHNVPCWSRQQAIVYAHAQAQTSGYKTDIVWDICCQCCSYMPLYDALCRTSTMWKACKSQASYQVADQACASRMWPVTHTHTHTHILTDKGPIDVPARRIMHSGRQGH